MEAAKFCPELKLYVHTGPNRTKSHEVIGKPDVLISSYAILRKDKALFSTMLFNYVILDEAQAIKNPQSNTTEACLSLKARRFLTLTGTPLENSISDLWSQVHFFNRNMLGTMSHFMQNSKNPEKLELYTYLLKPFLLRRNKSEVLTDLPEKTIITQWCDMNEQQQHFYREIRNTYRDKFLGATSTDDRVNTMVLLEGLLRLRQSANHPVLVDKEYSDDSGSSKAIWQKANSK
jgi:SNF2 family DNA or RNA helicase